MKKVLVLGDIILDRYIKYKYKKQCPDQIDVPAYYQTDSQTFVGGAANVALNLAELLDGEGMVYLCGSVNDEGRRLIKSNSQYKVNINDSYPEETIEKVRIFIGSMMMMRLDNLLKYSKTNQDFFYEDVVSFLSRKKVDAIIVSDYGAGFFSEKIAKVLHESGIPVFMDTKEKDLRKLYNPYVLKLNNIEYSEIGMIENRFPESYCQNCVVTDGANGASFVRIREDDGKKYIVDKIHFPLEKKDRKIIDTSGCGDTFLAGLVYKWFQTNDVCSSIDYANRCASSIVEELGTSCVKKEKIEE